MNLTALIESAEHQFKQILEEFFISFYDEKSPGSHGLDHHRRVWKYAKEITLFLGYKNLIRDFTLPDKLIIASYLHDIGMSVDKGFRHGNHSRNLCSVFLQKNNLKEADYQDVLLAVENHDNKEYKTAPQKHDLLTILSAADDLDALGFTGIYRYTEIYLLRDINLNDIGHLVKENAATRFKHFVKSFGILDELVEIQTARYQLLESFYTEYNNHLPDYAFGSRNPTGYCGVVEIINDLAANKTTFQSILIGQLNQSDDEIIHWFFNGLKTENEYH
jgi:HD superfamily phosphodiesterase